MKNLYKTFSLFIYFTIPLYGQKAVEVSEKTDSYDSLHFHINKMYYASGLICYTSYTDTIKKVRHQKTYNSNGKIETEGDLDDNKNYHIGIWKYYNKHGKFNLTNFDSTSKTSYYQAIQIAKNYGYKESGLEITEKIIKGNYYWEVSCWKKETVDPEIGEFILINRKNNKIIKPKNNKLVRYE